MRDEKYYYKGIPLSLYCNDNEINYNRMLSKIWKMKKTKKYDSFTEQEIVDIAIENYEQKSYLKYSYKGMSLRQYCLQNNLNYQKIYVRVTNLQKRNPTMKIEDIIFSAIENFENRNYRFFYKGMTLVEYCKKNPSVNYKTLVHYINQYEKENPYLSYEEIINKYLETTHRSIFKYYYLGIPLKEWCDENNLLYSRVMNAIRYYKNKDEFKSLSDEEIVSLVIDKYKPSERKYFYNGKSLYKYCEENNINYYSVVSYINDKKKKDPSISLDCLIEEGIKSIKKGHIVYYYNGVPLIEYAKENGLNSSSIRGMILRKLSVSDKPFQEVVNETVESYQKLSRKYFYKGESLYTFCKRVGLNYSKILSRYMNNYYDRDDISLDDAINEIVDDYLSNPSVRIKYYFNDKSLFKFCEEKGYSYNLIWRRLRTLRQNKDNIDINQLIEMAINKYEDKLKINKVNNIFRMLKNDDINDLDDLKKICKYLKIDLANVLELIDMNFSFNQAISTIWYFSDSENIENEKIITDKKLEELFGLVYKIKNASISEISNFDLYDLIGIYKSELYDTRNEILIREEKYINKIIYSLCSSYGIFLDKHNYQDFKSELSLCLIKLVDRVSVNTIGQIIKYIEISLNGIFKKYLKTYKEGNRLLSLDEERFKDGKMSNEKIIDYVLDTNNPYFFEEDNNFSDTMLMVLSNLNPKDLEFIVLKYQENYTDEELARYFFISVDDVREKEIEILNLLRQKEDIKKLAKKKHI